MSIFQQTTLSWSPVISWPLLLFWLLVCLGLAFLSWHRFRNLLGASSRLLLFSLRVLALLLSLLVLLQPMLKTSVPEAGSFRIAVLADRSRSMESKDSPNGPTRSETLRQLLSSPALAEISRLGDLEIQAFSEYLHPLSLWQDGALPVLPGVTDFGKILQLAAESRPGAAPLGAVVLFSDGNDSGDNNGPQIAKQFRQQQIPITCVGIGQRQAVRDISVRFQQAALQVPRDTPFELAADIESNYPDPLTLTTELLENGIVVQSQNVQVTPGEKQTARFSCTSATSGFRTWAVRIQAPKDDKRSDNNLDFTSVKVQEPERFSILYLGSTLNWEWRFLRIQAESNEQIQLAAIIQSGPKNYFRAGLSTDQLEGLEAFPEKTIFYADYDAVIIDSLAASRLSPAGCEALLAFVERKGGGLLLTGDPALLPEALHQILPLHEAEHIVAAQESRLLPDREIVFDRDVNLAFKQGRGIPLPPGSHLHLVRRSKLGARPALTLGARSEPLLIVQSYGAGRSAFLGIEETWKWRFATQDGENLHRAFWDCLLVWLAERQQPQLQPANDGMKIAVDEESSLSLHVLGTDFRPAAEADAMAIVSQPDGQIRELRLDPSAEEPGLFAAPFRPGLPGEYRIRWQVTLPEQNLACESILLARQTGAEMQNIDYSEETLRDIARISQGNFYRAEEFADAKVQIPLSPLLPQQQSTRPLASSWLFLILIAAAFSAEWAIRRHLGLK
jgi:hypothetical protein